MEVWVDETIHDGDFKAAHAAGLLRVFGDADRVRIVSALLDQKMNASTFAEMAGILASAVSHHLCVLRQMRRVKARRADVKFLTA